MPWEWAFHLYGIGGLVLFAAWMFFVADSPTKHATISMKETLYIMKGQNSQAGNTKTGIPYASVARRNSRGDSAARNNALCASAV